jgi:membrane-associated phospholipid phosphatase
MTMRAFSRPLLALTILGILLPPAARADEPYRLTQKDAALLLGGAAALGVGAFLLNSRTQEVPPAGLDPDAISLEWDRDALAVPNTSALGSSDACLVLAGVSPTAMFVVAGGDGRTWNAAGRLWTVQAEASLVAAGASFLLKRAASRPRPYTYLPESERPSGSEYDVTQERAFESMPSGHATVAWAGGLAGASYLAFSRPDLSGSVHFLSGVLAGGLATATGVLRVDAGQHFPSDVVAGSVLGAATGLGVAYLTRGAAPEEGSRGDAIRNCLLGAAAGTVIALLVTPPASPF